MILRARILVLGLSLSLSSGLGCSLVQATPCESSCAGCCDASGTCNEGTGTAACGSAGMACQSCTGLQVCSDGACVARGSSGGGGAAGGGAAGGGSVAQCTPADFSAAASFALPQGYAIANGTLPFDALAGSLYCVSTTQGGNPGYGIIDFDKDGLPDLLVTEKCDDTSVGVTRWLLYRNTGSGFSSTPTPIALPSGYEVTNGRVPFRGLASTSYCIGATGGGNPAFSLLDWNGDALPDLVVMDVCNDTTVGLSAWRVYLNTGAGFASSPTSFALPPGYAIANGTTPFDALAGSLYCVSTTQGGNPGYGIIDFDKDGLPDLLVTEKCDDTSVGVTRWLLYRNTGSGFSSTPTPIALPSGYEVTNGRSPFRGLASTSYCIGATGGGNPAFSLLDWNGDALPDLIVMDVCNDTTVGVSAWRVYLNTGAGFASSPTSFALPPGYAIANGTTPFDALAGTFYCVSTTQGGNPGYGITDFDKDGRPDLIVTEKCDDTSVGVTRWLLYRNTGSGFSSTPSPVPLPTGYEVTNGRVPFRHLASTSYCIGATGGGNPAFSLLDWNGDALPDLVVMDVCNDTTVGVSAWRVYGLRCN